MWSVAGWQWDAQIEGAVQMWAEAGEFGNGMVPEQLQTGHRFRFEIPKFHAFTIKLNYCPNFLYRPVKYEQELLQSLSIQCR